MNKKLKTLVIGGATLAVAAGGVFVPATYAADGSTIINATIGSAISIETEGTVDLNITPTSDGVASSANDKVTVATNNTTGYNLQLADSDGDNSLTGSAGTIAATSGTFGSPAAMNLNSWGYRVDGQGTFGNGPTAAQLNDATLAGTWAKVPLTGLADTLKTTSTTTSGDDTLVWYGAYVDFTTPNGDYHDTVTYTASVNL